MLFSVWQATLPLPLSRNQYRIEMYERDTSGKSLTEAGEAVYWSSIDRHRSQKTQFQTPLFPGTPSEPGVKTTLLDGLRGLPALHVMISNVYHT